MALADPILYFRNGTLKLGGVVLNANIFPALCNLSRPVDITEPVPLSVQKQWISSVMHGKLKTTEMTYYVNSELAECRKARPYYSLWLDQNRVPFGWAQASFRDPDAVGQAVAGVFDLLSEDEMAETASLADSLAKTLPVCPLLACLLQLSGASPDMPTNLDVICALSVAVVRYEGQLACAYRRSCENTARAIAILRTKCPPLQPHLLGLLSPLPLSQP
jgi:hypothetical protein